VVVSAIVVVAIFFLVATCRFKDTSWVSLFEAGKNERQWAMTYVPVRFRDAPPGVPRSPNFPSSDDEPPTSLWRGEGWGGVLAGDPGDRAHIPQQRGGANGVKVGGLRHIGGGGLLMCAGSAT